MHHARLLLISAVVCVATHGLARGQPAKPAQPAAGQPAAGQKADPKGASSAKPVEAEPGPEDQFEAMPRRKEMLVPTLEELFKGPAFDWMVIKQGENDRVLVVEPVDPRPGAVEFWNQRIKDTIGKTVAGETAEARERRLSLKFIRLTLREEKEQDYKVDLQYIREVIYFEDLMLMRVDLLLGEKKVRDALQLLLAIEARQRNWPGTVDRQKKLLLVESGVLLEKQPEQALVRLEELFARDPVYPELERQAGVVVDRLVSDAVSKSDFRRARHCIRRLQRMFGDHQVAKNRSTELLEQARHWISEAAAAEKSSQLDVAVNHIEQAARIWPETPELQNVHRRISTRFQRLRVGVWELSSPAERIAPKSGGDPAREADRRCRTMLEIPLFRPARFDKKVVRYEAPLLAEWEPTDLGHSLQLRLKPYRERWESRPTVTAGDVALSMARRLDPRQPGFDERLSTFVESLSVRTPEVLEIRFRNVPLRPEALFAFPVDISQPEAADDVAADSVSPTSPITWPFHEFARTDREVAFRRTVAEPSQPADWHLAEVVEVRYDNPDKAVQGLLRGEVQMLPRVPVWKLPEIEARGDFFSLPYDQPETHLLHFRSDSQLLASRTLRRAMIYSLNRPQVLQTVFLHDAPARFGRLSSGPISSDSYASNPQVTQHKFDPVLAVSLMPVVKKELGGKLPSILLRCPEDPHIRQAAARIIDSWKRLGLQVTLVPEDSEKWDLCYRVVRLSEPLVDLWPTMTYPQGTDVESLRTLVPWIREQLLQLDQSGDFPGAELQLHRLHKQLWAEIPMIPLWELQQMIVARKNIRGLPLRPFVTYDNIEQWKVDPWYSRD